MRREIDIYYPKLSPAMRFGHEFARDIQSIIGYVKSTIREREKMLDELNSADESWTRWFPPSTVLSLTPFQCQELIETRRKQMQDLQVELHKLRRRIQRLRCEPVKLYPDEIDDIEL